MKQNGPSHAMAHFVRISLHQRGDGGEFRESMGCLTVIDDGVIFRRGVQSLFRE